MRLKEFAATTALATVLTLGMAGAGAQAAFVPYASGSNSGANVTGTGAWSDATLTWSVEVDRTTSPFWTWKYSYTFDDPTPDQKALSHIIFEVSPGFSNDNILSSAPAYTPPAGATYGPGDPSNPGIPSSFSGTKWDTTGEPTTYTVTFTSDRAPLWGDWYAKDGKTSGVDIIAYNTAFGADAPFVFSYAETPGTLGNTAEIMRPDTAVVPIPAALPLLGTAVAGLGLAAWRRRAKAA